MIICVWLLPEYEGGVPPEGARVGQASPISLDQCHLKLLRRILMREINL